jgi:hypothetical protein
MSLDKKILEEIQRYKSINNYITEQDAIDDLTAPLPGAETAPAPGAETAPPAPGADTTPQPIDVETDPDVEKIDDEGKSEEGEESLSLIHI